MTTFALEFFNPLGFRFREDATVSPKAMITGALCLDPSGPRHPDPCSIAGEMEGIGIPLPLYENRWLRR